MSEQESAIHVVPTQLERSDGFLDLTALATAVIADWESLLHGVPWWLLVVPTLVVAMWVLTGEASADVPYLGAVAGPLRSRIGLRRANEWVFAWWHYFGIRTWPDWTAQCKASWASARQRTTDWLRLLNAAIRWRLSRARSWGSATRYSWSLRRARLRASTTGRIHHK